MEVVEVRDAECLNEHLRLAEKKNPMDVERSIEEGKLISYVDQIHQTYTSDILASRSAQHARITTCCAFSESDPGLS